MGDLNDDVHERHPCRGISFDLGDTWSYGCQKSPDWDCGLTIRHWNFFVKNARSLSFNALPQLMLPLAGAFVPIWEERATNCEFA